MSEVLSTSIMNLFGTVGRAGVSCSFGRGKAARANLAHSKSCTRRQVPPVTFMTGESFKSVPGAKLFEYKEINEANETCGHESRSRVCHESLNSYRGVEMGVL